MPSGYPRAVARERQPYDRVVNPDKRYRRGSVLLELTTATALLARLLERELARLGLRPTHGDVLALVHIHGPVTPSDLERESGMAGATLRRIVAALEEEEYVVRIGNPSDRRSFFLDSTSKGEAYLEAMVPAMRTLERRLEEALGASLETYREPMTRLRVAAQELLAPPR